MEENRKSRPDPVIHAPFGIEREAFREAAIVYRYGPESGVVIALRRDDGGSDAGPAIPAEVWNEFAHVIEKRFNERLTSRGFAPGEFPTGRGCVHLHMQFGRELWVWAKALQVMGRSERGTIMRALPHLTPADCHFIWGMHHGRHWAPFYATNRRFLPDTEEEKRTCIRYGIDTRTDSMIICEIMDRADGIRIDTLEQADADPDRVRMKSGTPGISWANYTPSNVDTTQKRVREAEKFDENARSWSVESR